MNNASPRGAAAALAVLGLLATPSVVSAAARTDGSNCEYTQDEAINTYGWTPPGPKAVVYAGGDGVSGQADYAAGACMDANGAASVGAARSDGGSLEAGLGSPIGDGPTGVYAIADGDNDNTDTPFITVLNSEQPKGFVGVSNFETGENRTTCEQWPPSSTGSGTNSGGCFTVRHWGVAFPVPLLACGSTTAYDYRWEQDAGPDGCSIHPYVESP